MENYTWITLVTLAHPYSTEYGQDYSRVRLGLRPVLFKRLRELDQRRRELKLITYNLREAIKCNTSFEGS